MAAGDSADDPDGFGQSLLDDVRFAHRFRKLRRETLALSDPDPTTARAIADDPLVGRFGDDTMAVGTVAGRSVSIRERDWFGWPDPRRYVLFVRDPDGSVWCAKDFDRWPDGWTVDGKVPG